MKKCRTHCFGWILLALAGVALLGGIVMLLWNTVLTAVFPGVAAISYLQAVGILILSRILFGGLRGFHRGGHCRWQGEQMKPEEREQLREYFFNRFGRCRTPHTEE